MSHEKLLARHPLANGLTLEFWDLSRHAAGDRWQVVLEARVVIPVAPETLPAELKARLDEVIASLGPEVVFAQQEVRNFVGETEVGPLLRDMQAWVFQALHDYLGHPDFAARFLAMRFNEYQQRQLPLWVIVIDALHWTLMGDWQFDPVSWPDPTGMIAELEAMGMPILPMPCAEAASGASTSPSRSPRARSCATCAPSVWTWRNGPGRAF